MSEVESALLAELQASKQRAEELAALLESERRRAAEAEHQLRFSLPQALSSKTFSSLVNPVVNAPLLALRATLVMQFITPTTTSAFSKSPRRRDPWSESGHLNSPNTSSSLLLSSLELSDTQVYEPNTSGGWRCRSCCQIRKCARIEAHRLLYHAA